MLTIEQLEEFEARLKSGQLEEEFRNCDETRRYQILALLEKLMDVADIADETATRIIFRGMRLPPDMAEHPQTH